MLCLYLQSLFIYIQISICNHWYKDARIKGDTVGHMTMKKVHNINKTDKLNYTFFKTSELFFPVRYFHGMQLFCSLKIFYKYALIGETPYNYITHH